MSGEWILVTIAKKPPDSREGGAWPMPRATGLELTRATLEELKRDLAKLPDVDRGAMRVSLKEAVAELAPTILDLQNRGYTLEAITEELGTRGLKIGRNTLKNYMQKLKKPRHGAMRRSAAHRTRPHSTSSQEQSEDASGGSSTQSG
jgi:hypothetical protein